MSYFKLVTFYLFFSTWHSNRCNTPSSSYPFLYPWPPLNLLGGGYLLGQIICSFSLTLPSFYTWAITRHPEDSSQCWCCSFAERRCWVGVCVCWAVGVAWVTCPRCGACPATVLRGINLSDPRAGTQRCQPPKRELASWPLVDRTQDVSSPKPWTWIIYAFAGFYSNTSSAVIHA